MVKIETVREGADRVFSILVLIMAIVFFITCFSLPEKSALLPRLIAAFTAICNLPVIIGMWRNKKNVGEEHVVVPIYWSALALVGYYLILMFFGYIISSFLLIIIFGRMVGQKNWIILILLAIVMTGSTYYVFGKLFGVVLPNGLLFDALL